MAVSSTADHTSLAPPSAPSSAGHRIRRFGRFGDALACTLHQFSLDVVDVVASYWLCAIPSAGAQPRLLHSFLIDDRPGAGAEQLHFPWSMSPLNGGSSTYASAAAGSADGVVVCGPHPWKCFLYTDPAASASSSQLMPASPVRAVTGACVNAWGRLLVSDVVTKVVAVCAGDGSVARLFGERGELRSPQEVAVDDAWGLVFVADCDNHCVRLFHWHSAAGELVRSIGTFGGGDGQLMFPCGVAFNRDAYGDGEVFVTSRQKHRVEVFNTEGRFLRSIGSKGVGDNQLFCPTGVCCDIAVNVLVADTGNGCVKVFSADGGFITQFGGPGESDGQFDNVCTVRVDDANRILVGDRKRVQVFAF